MLLPAPRSRVKTPGTRSSLTSSATRRVITRCRQGHEPAGADSESRPIAQLGRPEAAFNSPTPACSAATSRSAAPHLDCHWHVWQSHRHLSGTRQGLAKSAIFQARRHNIRVRAVLATSSARHRCARTSAPTRTAPASSGRRAPACQRVRTAARAKARCSRRAFMSRERPRRVVTRGRVVRLEARRA